MALEQTEGQRVQFYVCLAAHDDWIKFKGEFEKSNISALEQQFARALIVPKRGNRIE